MSHVVSSIKSLTDHQSKPTRNSDSANRSHLGTIEAASELSISYRSVESLKPYPGNARTHSPAQIRKLKESIRVFGFVNPVLIHTDGTIIAGHGRVQAAKLLGMTAVPTIGLESLTQDQVRAYVIADNRLALEAGWDDQILKIELQHLSLITDFDVTITGFEIPEIDIILGAEPTKADDPADEIPEDDFLIITQPGDLWALGKHRIFCGDARNESSFADLMGKRRAGVVFTDPPYNVVLNGHATGKGKVHHREFAMASGEMSEAEFTEFLTDALTQLSNWSAEGSVHFIAMDWRHMPERLAAGRKIYDSLLNLCVWNKDNGGMGSLYRSQHELFFVFKSGKGSHRNNVQLGKFGRNRTNVWNYPGANTRSRTGEEGNVLSMHPTVKPVALIADALLDCSRRGDIVLDSFLGAGSTLLAAERVGRICCGIEIEGRYVDLTIRRWQRLTGESAIHSATGKTFDELAATEVCHG